MKFVLIDRVTELEPGQRITAEKALSLAEEYLADHFPTFPVLPGVLMLEAMVQASAWLVRVARNFEPALVVLHEARNVTYKSFLAPGKVLRVVSQCKSLDQDSSTFAASGYVDQREIVKARLTLRHVSLADQDASLLETDERLREHFRKQWHLLTASGPPVGAVAAERSKV